MRIQEEVENERDRAEELEIKFQQKGLEVEDRETQISLLKNEIKDRDIIIEALKEEVEQITRERNDLNEDNLGLIQKHDKVYVELHELEF